MKDPETDISNFERTANWQNERDSYTSNGITIKVPGCYEIENNRNSASKLSHDNLEKLYWKAFLE